MIGKFESGVVGEEAGDEVKQMNAVLKYVHEYITEPYDKFAKYGVTYEMHRSGVFTQSYLSRRISNLPTFRKDRIGASAALKRVIKNLIENDEIRELGVEQKRKDFAFTGRAFAVSAPKRFFDAGSIKSGGGV